MKRDRFEPLRARTTIANPTPEELAALAARMPNARSTNFANLNVQTNVVSRSKRSTFLVDDGVVPGHQVVSRADAARIAGYQTFYVSEQEMVVIDGFIGNDPDFRVPARLYVEAANANIAAMQKQLYFEQEDEVEPELTVVYTPNLRAPGFPDERLILVDLEHGVTRVFNSDYFGESKKGGLRMWNHRVFEQGGLSLHAGCKIIPTAEGRKVALVVGLSGTGKTTTTFTRQNGSVPVQDDFVAWMPDGRIYATEAGCFAKTYGLNADDEPTIFGAVTSPAAYLENVSQHGSEVDFYDTSYTKNGRATFSLSAIESGVEEEIANPDFLLILNRSENVIPAVAKLSGTQAAAYFMLGETKGTSAGGADEAGKFLRVPGTNPFFPLPHEHQGNRFLELLLGSNLDVYLMNTGTVGGPDGDERAKKVQIAHSSAIVKGIAEETIVWEDDPDFGYLVASFVPGIDDIEVLQPRRLYARTNRRHDYVDITSVIKAERKRFLRSFAGLHGEVAAAV